MTLAWQHCVTGRRQKKTIFVYLTHSFERACQDWSLISAIDVWVTGHKHLYWQSFQGTVLQEHRHFPLRILIGNGGFDEGQQDVVSFGELREEVYEASDGSERVKIHLKVFDTCVSDEFHCPMLALGGPYCWTRCKAMDGGVDGGGGPRRATPGRSVEAHSGTLRIS